MRRFLSLLAAIMLAACQMQAPAGPARPGSTEEISVSKLDSPAGAETAPNVQTPDTSTPRPQARPAAPAPTDAAGKAGAATPAVKPDPAKPGTPPDAKPEASTAPDAAPTPLSPEEAICVKSKGIWSPLENSSGHVCVHSTRDAGKVCHRKGQCQGECLAQSNTCSPIMPLMGCNAILQADGSEVTLCLQ